MKIRKLPAIISIFLVSCACVYGAAAGEDGAKSLFARQMSEPTESLNVGVQYWIELHRGNQVIRVNNRTSFQSGDKIRFHVTPNVNGYAYILLRSGSRGEQSVLFPDPARAESNKVVAGNDYTLPKEDFLQFDNNPGQEKLTLLVSRLPVDATAYLRTPETDRILIASAATGSKDLVPSRIVISIATIPEAVSRPEASNSSHPSPAKVPAIAHKKKKAVVHHRGTETTVVHRQEPENTVAYRQGTESTVTIVNTDPKGVLAIDVSLEHL